MEEYVGPDPEAEEGEKGETEEPNAGMQLTLAGNQLRPFVFFKSSGDLMSLYWSGALDNKNTAIQGNMMVQDDVRTLRLASGLNVDLSATGALSFDSSGKASVSLFSQTADTMIENAGAFVFQSDAVLSFKDSTHRLARMTESLETRMSLDSRTNIDVGGGQMCIRVTQPRTDLVTRRSFFKDSKEVASSVQNDSSQAKSLFLDKRISDMCKAMRGI